MEKELSKNESYNHTTERRSVQRALRRVARKQRAEVRASSLIEQRRTSAILPRSLRSKGTENWVSFMKEISLIGKYSDCIVLVDDEDNRRLNFYQWYGTKTKSGVRATTSVSLQS